MNPVAKALWFIESHFTQEITLDDIAQVAGISRFHMSRAFSSTTGHSVTTYVRGRRLTQAAHALSAGAPDIFAVALEAGYGSHEAFTRAFRDQFGLTPEAVRAEGHTQNIKLMEPIKMNETLLDTITPPRLEQGKSLLIAGLNERYSGKKSAEIPAQWQRFGPYIGTIPGQIGPFAYGAIYNTDDEGNADYLCGVEVSNFSSLPAELARLRIPEHHYAAFQHREHISTIRRTWNTIWSKGLHASVHKAADAPMFERYGPEFDPRTGMGGLEIWIPIAD